MNESEQKYDDLVSRLYKRSDILIRISPDGTSRFLLDEAAAAIQELTGKVNPSTPPCATWDGKSICGCGALPHTIEVTDEAKTAALLAARNHACCPVEEWVTEVLQAATKLCIAHVCNRACWGEIGIHFHQPNETKHREEEHGTST